MKKDKYGSTIMWEEGVYGTYIIDCKGDHLSEGSIKITVCLTDSYDYPHFTFVVKNVDSLEGALEAIGRYCSDHHIHDGCLVYNYDDFVELCEACHIHIDEDTDDLYIAEKLDLIYTDCNIYLDTVHLKWYAPVGYAE